jgi:pyrroline-5-carboxylate reductase
MTLGFLGVGNMMGAILEAALKEKVISSEQAFIYDVSAERLAALTDKLCVRTCETPQELASAGEVILLGVKPNQVEAALSELDLNNKALISIAAGWGSEALKNAAAGARVLRVMPNMPAMMGAGMTALSLAHTLTPDEVYYAEALFRSIGLIEWVEEYQMDAVTGISGSGPAYAFMFIEALADAGVAEGLSRAAAIKIAAQTLLGSAKTALEGNLHPAQLKDMVASPGGTTIEAIRTLEKRGFRSAIIEGAIAAIEKSKKMRP